MIAVKTVLAASDLSTSARAAIARAGLICRTHQARLQVIHVIEELPPPALLSGEQARDKARNELAIEAKAAVPEGIDCRQEIATGKDFVAIIRHARETLADLIVVGAHGHHLLRDYLLGTTAEKLIRKAALPVLVVKHPPHLPYRRILVPTDFSEPSWQALAAASVLAPGASIDLLHIYGFWGEGRLGMAGAGAEAIEAYRQQTEAVARGAMDEWQQGLDLSGHHVERHFRQGHAATVISQFAAERQHDLIVMGTAGRTGLPYILLGSVTEHTLRTAPCDTLTVRPTDFRFELP